MKMINTLRRMAFTGIFIFLSLFVTFSPAQADVIDTMANVLDEIGPANPFAIYGIDGQALKDSKGLITCMAGGGDPIMCIDDFRNTPIGAKLAGEANDAASQAIDAVGLGIPSWFWDLIDLYVAFVENDFWGIIANIGEAAYCAVAQSLTGGAFDVCGVIENLVQLAGEAYDVAADILGLVGIDLGAIVEDVAAFFSDLGEGVIAAVECLFGSCGEEGPTVEQMAGTMFAVIFHPYVDTGVSQLGRSDTAFDDFVGILRQYALSAYGSGAKQQDAVNRADSAYRLLVDTKWTATVTQSVLPAREQEKTSAAPVNSIAGDIWDEFLANRILLSSLMDNVPGYCYWNYFKDHYTYGQIDRWITKHPNEANAAGAKTNNNWCTNVFSEGYATRNMLENRFEQLKQNYINSQLNSTSVCPKTDQRYICGTSANYQKCLSTFAYVGEPGADWCALAVTTSGKNAADYVTNLLRNEGYSSLKAAPANPVDIECTRPVTHSRCNILYAENYKNLPTKYANCVLKEDSNYTALKSQVNNAVSQINGKFNSTLLVIQNDPLLVERMKSQSALLGKGGQTLEQIQQAQEQMQARAAEIQAEMNKDWFTVPPSTTSKFIIVNGSVPNYPKDGLSAPTIKVVEIGPPTQSKGPLSGAKIDTSKFKPQVAGQTAGSKLQNQLASGGFTPNPVDENSGGSSGIDGIGGIGPGLGGMAGVGSKGTGFGGGPGTIGNATGPGFSGVAEGLGQGSAERLKDKVGGFTGGGNTSVTIPGSSGVGSDGPVTSPVATGSMLSGLSEVGSLNKATGPAYAAGSGPNAQSSLDKRASVSSLTSTTAVSTQYGNQNTVGQSQQQQQQLMSGSVPGGAPQQPAMTQALQSAAAQKTGAMAATAKANTGAPPQTPNSPSPMSPMSGSVPQKPDITAATQVTIAGKPSRWNGIITVDERQAASKSNGLCSVILQYSVTNTGTAPTSMFKSAWTNSAMPGSWGKNWQGIAPGASLAQSDTLILKPGLNMLTLSVDSANQVQETNEANNTFRVTVTVTGTCGAAGMTSPATLPGSPAGPKMPAMPQPKPGRLPQLGR